MLRPLSLLTASLLLIACNTTPEMVVNEAFPSISPAQTTPAETTETPASSSSTQTTTQTTAPSPAPSSGSQDPAAEPIVTTVSSGSFEDRVHKVSGEARLVTLGEQRILRLENFTTENGPDLFIYLVKNNTGSPQGQDFVNLGRVKSTRGNFNYDVPADINLEEFQSVSVWCQAFSVNFGTAVLN